MVLHVLTVIISDDYTCYTVITSNCYLNYMFIISYMVIQVIHVSNLIEGLDASRA